MIRYRSLVWLLASIALVANGGCRKQVAPEKAAASTESSELPARATLASGEAEFRKGNATFARFEKTGQTQTVTEVRASATQGATVVLGSPKEPQGKLWLRAGAAARLAEDAEGRLVVEPVRGELRARSYDEERPVTLRTKGRTQPLPQGDALIDRRGDAQTVVATAKNPGAADWSFQAAENDTVRTGVGELRARDEGDREIGLGLERVHVAARIEGDLAETRVEHVFANTTKDRLEGTFRMRLPEEASLVGLAMDIGGKMMEGSLVEIDKARRIYQSIVDEMLDPAILEWEHGTTFKLRVFPIEPRSTKRIVIRYVAPLRQDVGGTAYVLPLALPDLAGSPPRLKFDFEGKTVFDQAAYRKTGEIVVPVSADRLATKALQEARKDGTYTAVRVGFDWDKVSASEPAVRSSSKRRRVIVACDSSRSTLESRPLLLDSLRAVLSELGPRDKFAVFASDVDVHDAKGGFVAPSDEAIEKAARFVGSIEPDGASDVGAALRHAADLAARARKEDPEAKVQVVYVGDGKATWGDTAGKALAEVARERLRGAELVAMLLGNEVDADLAREIASARGGWVARPRTPLAAYRFAMMLAHSGDVRRLDRVTLSAGEGREVAPAIPTWIEGEERVVVVRTPAGERPPTSLRLEGDTGGRRLAIDVPVGSVAPAKHVARRWAANLIGSLEKDPSNKDAVVKLSLDHGVMSRHTAFLVLESEEAYAKYAIERKAEKSARVAKADKPQVSGADLESVSRQAGMNMDRVQPGDPEIHIPAPRDAQSVVVVFPFGETKVASFEPSLGAWTVRFLIDAGTPDGTYAVTVRVTHADGRVEVLELSYVVDTHKPVVELSLRPVSGKPGSFELHASQVLTDEEVRRALPSAARDGAVDRVRARSRDRIADLSRVEVRLPDGSVLPLAALRAGEFVAAWPGAVPESPVKLHVVAVDRALNQATFDVAVAPEAE